MCTALVACNSGSELPGDPERGQALYETGGQAAIPCASCHSLDGTRIVGPSFQGLLERAGSRTPGLDAESYIRQSIREPSAYVVHGYDDVMPKVYGEKLTEEDINDLLAFLILQAETR